jgi:hypothetical protein
MYSGTCVRGIAVILSTERYSNGSAHAGRLSVLTDRPLCVGIYQSGPSQMGGMEMQTLSDIPQSTCAQFGVGPVTSFSQTQRTVVVHKSLLRGICPLAPDRYKRGTLLFVTRGKPCCIR